MRSAAATSTEAPPPKPFRSATICGMAVMRTFSASTAPMAPPTAIPASTTPNAVKKPRPAPSSNTSGSVSRIAKSMPRAPMRLPRTAVRGWQSIFRQ